MKPYRRKDGRWVVVYKRPNGKSTSKSYPRLLMEVKLGRALLSHEQVHHKDHNPDNNAIENLEVLGTGAHAERHARPVAVVRVSCPACNEEFEYSRRRWLDNQVKQGKAGPFCGRVCLNKHRAAVAKRQTRRA